jgi:membrane peptidoglycan carboxypeptidase
LAAFGDRLGLTPNPLPRVPSIALGAFESSLLDVTAAYTAFAEEGLRAEPRSVLSVKAASGVVLRETGTSRQRVSSPTAARAVHTMLEGVVDRGTARAIRAAGLAGAMGGKTGTSSEQRDAWYVGYTPSLVLGVWIGFDDDRPLHASASELAVPLWAAIARRALAGQEVGRFPEPTARLARAEEDWTE